jgi:hypothetical protein
VVAAERVLLVLVRLGLPRAVVDLFVALRLVAAADRLPLAERFALLRLVAAPLDVDFLLVERLLPR